LAKSAYPLNVQAIIDAEDDVTAKELIVARIEGYIAELF
tara:strand:+ start:734 stop:850 length:117 start_codon:yes stop_codon:yes gene_type:complete